MCNDEINHLRTITLENITHEDDLRPLLPSPAMKNASPSLRKTLSEKKNEDLEARLWSHLKNQHRSTLSQQTPPFYTALHIQKCLRALNSLDRSHQHLEASRPWILYWNLHSLDLLGALEQAFRDTTLQTFFRESKKCSDRFAVPLAVADEDDGNLSWEYGKQGQKTNYDSPLYKCFRLFELDFNPEKSKTVFCPACGFTVDLETIKRDLSQKGKGEETTEDGMPERQIGNMASTLAFPSTCTLDLTYLDSSTFETLHAQHVKQQNPECPQASKVRPLREEVVRFISSCFSTTRLKMRREGLGGTWLRIRRSETSTDDKKERLERFPPSAYHTKDCPMHKDLLSQASELDERNSERKIGGGYGGGPSQLPHLATSYACVQTLLLIGSTGFVSAYDSIDRESLANWISSLRNPQNGSFAMHEEGEVDLRASYCAAVLCTLLDLPVATFWGHSLKKLKDPPVKISETGFAHKSVSNLDTLDQNRNSLTCCCSSTFPSLPPYLLACQTYEGGFACNPWGEAHGGYSFCAMATLLLTGAQHGVDLSALHRWITARQFRFPSPQARTLGGFHGRTNKLVDACYTFWIGSLFSLLKVYPMIQRLVTHSTPGSVSPSEAFLLRNYNIGEVDVFSESCSKDPLDFLPLESAHQVLRYVLWGCQDSEEGGFCDQPGSKTDFYHTCYTLSGLSILYQNFPSAIVQDVLPGLIYEVNPLFNLRCCRVRDALYRFGRRTSWLG